jgi:hypothetical protein
VLARRYGAPDGHSVDVWVLYFDSQRQGKELISSRGDALHRAAERVDASFAAGSHAEVNLVRLKWPPSRRAVLA